MPFYKNVSNHDISFYGVKIHPGQVEELPQYVNNVHLIEVEEPEPAPELTKKRTRRKKQESRETVGDLNTTAIEELAEDLAITAGTEE